MRNKFLWYEETELLGLHSKHHVWRRPDSAHHLPNPTPMVMLGGIMLRGVWQLQGLGYWLGLREILTE